MFIWTAWTNAANKYYSSAGHHEQKNKETVSQIKVLVVTIKQIKLDLQHSLFSYDILNLMYWFKCYTISQFHLQYYLSSQRTQQYIISSFDKESNDCKCLLFM